MKRILIVVLCLSLAGIALVATGCGKSAAQKAAEKAIEKSTNGQANVDISNQSVTININGSSYQGGTNLKLPSGFPSDVYVIDGTIIAASTIKEGESYAITIQTTTTIAAAKDAYENQLKAQGWTIVMSVSVQDGATIGATKDDRTCTVTIGTSEGKTSVSVAVAKKVQ